MMKERELSPLELNILTGLVAQRQKLQNEEFEFVQLLFKAQGIDFPKTNVELKDGKLVWIEVIEPEIVQG